MDSGFQRSTGGGAGLAGLSGASTFNIKTVQQKKLMMRIRVSPLWQTPSRVDALQKACYLVSELDLHVDKKVVAL